MSVFDPYPSFLALLMGKAPPLCERFSPQLYLQKLGPGWGHPPIQAPKVLRLYHHLSPQPCKSISSTQSPHPQSLRVFSVHGAQLYNTKLQNLPSLQRHPQTHFVKEVVVVNCTQQDSDHLYHIIRRKTFRKITGIKKNFLIALDIQVDCVCVCVCKSYRH